VFSLGGVVVQGKSRCFLDAAFPVGVHLDVSNPIMKVRRGWQRVGLVMVSLHPLE
jgi:hypothetical protein